MFSRFFRPNLPLPYLSAALILGMAAVVAAVFLFVRAQEKAQDAALRQQQVRSVLPVLAVQPAVGGGVYVRDEAVRAGDDLAAVLARIGISETERGQILDLIPGGAARMVLKPHQPVGVETDADGRVLRIRLLHDGDEGDVSLLSFERQETAWRVQTEDMPDETLTVFKNVAVKTSFRGDLARAGIPVEVREAVREMFAGRLDVARLEKGDAVRILYDVLYFRGAEMATGTIRAVEISSGGTLFRAYYFGSGSVGHYYDETGEPLSNGFDIQPVAGARISSPYGMRIHPVLGGWRMHTGIDYAAPTGTPVAAPADGVVEYRGYRGGYGNTVVLRHNDYMETLYAHLSGFSPLAELGTAVRAGEVIGYVGSTGRSTGPHLHYEVRLGGQHVNPALIALPPKHLDEGERPLFAADRQRTETLFLPWRQLPVTAASYD